MLLYTRPWSVSTAPLALAVLVLSLFAVKPASAQEDRYEAEEALLLMPPISTDDVDCEDTPWGMQCSFSAPPGSPPHYWASAQWHFATQNYPAAVESLNRFLDLKPENTHARALRGYALGAMGEVTDAMREFRAALEINNQDPEVYYRRARVKGFQGDLRGASDDLRRAIEIDDSDYRLYFMLSVIHGEMKDYPVSYAAALLAVGEVR